MATSFARPRAALVIGLVAVVALLVGACGSEESPGDEAVGEGAPYGGAFADLPQVPRSEPAGTRSEQGGVVVRSYSVAGASPDRVMDFYERTLPERGWEVLQEPERSGTSTITAEWTRDDLTLRITANDAPSLGGDTNPTEAVRSQYSLLLSSA